MNTAAGYSDRREVQRSLRFRFAGRSGRSGGLAPRDRCAAARQPDDESGFVGIQRFAILVIAIRCQQQLVFCHKGIGKHTGNKAHHQSAQKQGCALVWCNSIIQAYLHYRRHRFRHHGKFLRQSRQNLALGKIRSIDRQLNLNLAADVMQDPEIKAEVIAVFPDKVKISVDDIASFSDGKSIKVGSYLRITDNEDCALIAIIENFCIEVTDKAERRHIIEALPLGIIRDGKFLRGGDTLTIPPTGVSPATEEDIRRIFSDSVAPERKFEFCSLVSNDKIPVPVDGNRFFNKHIAVVGSTGAGKSHTITKIIQNGFPVEKGVDRRNACLVGHFCHIGRRIDAQNRSDLRFEELKQTTDIAANFCNPRVGVQVAAPGEQGCHLGIVSSQRIAAWRDVEIVVIQFMIVGTVAQLRCRT